MSGTTIVNRMGAAAMVIPTYSGDGLYLIIGASVCVVVFRYIIGRARGAVGAGVATPKYQTSSYGIHRYSPLATPMAQPEFKSRALHQISLACKTS